MQKELIPFNPKQSFRLFSWKGSLDNIQLNHSDDGTLNASGTGSDWHYHPEVELTLFTVGEGIRNIGDDVSSFEALDLVLLGPNLPHQWCVDRSSGYCIQFTSDQSSPLAGLHEFGSLKNLLDQSKQGLQFSNKCSTDVLELLKQGIIQSDPIERLAIFLRILNRLSKDHPTCISSYIPHGLNHKNGASVTKAVQYIVANATSGDLELQHVLDHINMSRATFARHFQNALGQSYTQFVQSIRLVSARKMLSSTNRPITEIAYASGFSNLSYFNSLFKKRWNMSPSGLRRLLDK